MSASAVYGAEGEGTLIPRLEVHVQKSSLCKAVTLISWALGTHFYLWGCCGHPRGTCCCSLPTEVFFRELKLIRVFLHEHSLVRVGALWYSLQKWLSIRCWHRQSTNECLLEGWGLVKLEMTGPKRADGSHSGFSPNLNSLFYKRVADTFLCGRRFERFPSISPVSSLCGDVSLKRTSPHLSRASSFLNQSEVLFTRSSVFLMSLLAPLYQPAALFCWLMDRWTPTYLSSPSSDVILTLLLHQTPLPE